jgi:hypothetical protein
MVLVVLMVRRGRHVGLGSHTMPTAHRAQAYLSVDFSGEYGMVWRVMPLKVS